MLQQLPRPAPDIAPSGPPRARGLLRITAEVDATGAARLGLLRQEGALRALFPRLPNRVEAVVLNTSGGATGGDRLRIEAEAGPGAHLRLTTQAAERAYRATGSVPARIRNHLRVATGARLDWLPQETILFEGCHLDRRLTLDLAPGGRALIVEPVIFGRVLMGESLRDARFRDRVEIRRDGVPLYLDALSFSGDVTAHLARPAVANGAAAMASVILAAPEAESHLAPLRAALPAAAGATLLAPDLLVLRLLAADGFDLRAALLPVLDRLTGGTLPASWRL
ncbi:urease accessory protein UreD [Limimaricola cinnabarinus]|uniref:Urease accessory protein UreD n=1 Tax=Limimaricola cinnabarinus LL-001 TaxID=1337093 RepID=U2Z1F4_9RHOB|nr:urease accessory protein UreD [Limimaricola cinnabarinus]GAD55190.1 urease accessory protein ureD [Limimaricola cinnabarinus LL-001]